MSNYRHPIIQYFLHNQILVALAVVAGLYLLFQVRDILVLIFIAYIIMAALNPFVEFLEKRRVPKILAVLTVYVVVLTVLIMTIFPLVPFVATQVISLFKNFPFYLDQASRALGFHVNTSQLNSSFTQDIGGISQNAFAVTTLVFGGFFSLIAIFVISFYFLIDHEHMKKTIVDLFPKDSHKKIYETLILVEEKLGAWLRGQIVLSLSIGICTWVAYMILGLDFALPLALLAGLLEAVPTIGPFLGAIPAIIVALTISPTKTILVIVAYIIIQALESNILVPKIMERAVGLSPIVIIIGIMVGAQLMGLWGALLSIPFISMLVLIYQNLLVES